MTPWSGSAAERSIRGAIRRKLRDLRPCATHRNVGPTIHRSTPLAALAVIAFLAEVLAPATVHAEAIPLYPGGIPGAERWTHAERSYYSEIFATEVVTNVARPTLAPFLAPADNATGTAVIIAPGGGFHALSIDSEGNDVARWLNARGVSAFVLRYRLVPTGEDGGAEMIAKSPEQRASDMTTYEALAGADALAAMRLVRDRAQAFGIAPDRIGFMGFSAGGMVAVAVAFQHDANSQPAFVAPIYAGLGPFGDVVPPPGAPPLFIAAATDDQLGLARDSVALYETWRVAGKPAELHMYASGGHGFGMRTQNLPSDHWIERFGDWLRAAGLMATP